MAASDYDARYETFSSILGPLNDTIVGTPTVTVARQDGQPIAPEDLAVVSGTITIDSTALVVTFWLQAGTNLAIYAIAVTVITVAGRKITRTGTISVVKQLG